MDPSLIDLLALLRLVKVPLDQYAMSLIWSAYFKVTESQGWLHLVHSWTGFYLFCYSTILKYLLDESPTIISIKTVTRKHLIIQTTYIFSNDNLEKV